MEGRYRMIQGSEDAVLWLQLSEALTAGMLGDLRGKRRRKGKYSQDRKEGRFACFILASLYSPDYLPLDITFIALPLPLLMARIEIFLIYIFKKKMAEYAPSMPDCLNVC